MQFGVSYVRPTPGVFRRCACAPGSRVFSRKRRSSPCLPGERGGEDQNRNYWRYELERGLANQDETRPPSSFSTALVLPPFFRSQRLWMQPRVSAVLTPTNSTEEPILATRKLRAALNALPLRRNHAPPQLVLRMLGTPLPRPLYTTRATPTVPPALQLQIRPKRRERQKLVAPTAVPAFRRIPHHQQNDTPRSVTTLRIFFAAS
jgi:hypothetical protein